MSQLELLWDYQQADVEAERQENTMKRSPTRQRLLKYQEYLREQKAANARLEEEVHAMGDRMDALKDAIAHTEEQLRALHDRFEADRPEDSEGMQTYIQETQRLLQNVSGYEQEVRRIRKDAADRDSQQRDIVQRAAKVRSDYDRLKAEYDVEYKENLKKLEELRAAGLKSDLDHAARSMKAQFKYANKVGVKKVVVIAGDELEKGVVKLRDMENSTEEEVARGEIVARLLGEKK